MKRKKEKRWKAYEECAFRALESRFEIAHLAKDEKILGKYSRTRRQIDVTARAIFAGKTIFGIVDCKYYNQKVNVKHVESVIGMASDLSADIAIIITTKGYSKAATNRASNDDNLEVHLDILTVSEAEEIEKAPAAASMYRGRIGALVLVPSGWTVESNIFNGKKRTDLDALCLMFHVGSNFPKAMANKSVGWCNIFEHRKGEENQLEAQLHTHSQSVYRYDPNAEIETWNESVREMKLNATFRKTFYESQNYYEVAVFIEIPAEGVFWTCLICKSSTLEKRLQQLRFIANNLMLILAPEADRTNSDQLWQRYFKWE